MCASGSFAWKGTANTAKTLLDGTSGKALVRNAGDFNRLSNLTLKKANKTFNGLWTAKTGGQQVYGANLSRVDGTGYWKSGKFVWTGGKTLTLYARWK